jgi:hypothetical protein
MKLKPEILCHPNIPKPLHGINPRTIKGERWWNEERQKIYASTDYHCIACGIHKTEARGHKWIEAHEFWDIDYMTGICKILSIEPLCHYCHNFIHSGRLKMILGKQKTTYEIINILEHGFKILSENNLPAMFYTIDFAKEIGAKTFDVKSNLPVTNPSIDWKDWKLIYEKKEYYSKFESYEDWEEHYQNK